MTKAAVLGAGAWGTTFAGVLADAGTTTVLWGRDTDVIDSINRHNTNPRFLPNLPVNSAITATADVAEALADADFVFVALPAQHLRSIIADWKQLVPAGAVVVSLMKGIEVGSHKRMSQVLQEVWDLPTERVAVVSGPNLAREIAQRQPTATVIATTDADVAERLTAATASGYFRPYTNADLVGVELCGAYKNVIAVGVGITDGRGFGHNTTATIITRGLAEITRLGLALGAQPETFSGLAGMGDLIATCASPLSRNHQLGSKVGAGLPLELAIERTGGTAEGVKSSLSIQELAAATGVEVPICEGVVAMLHDGRPIDAIMEALLSRPRKAESE